MRYRLHEQTSIQVYWEGDWVQVALIVRSSWTYPDQDKNARLRAATKDIGTHIVNLLNGEPPAGRSYE